MSFDSCTPDVGITYFEGTVAIAIFPWRDARYGSVDEIIFDMPGVMPIGTQLASLAGTWHSEYGQVWLGSGGVWTQVGDRFPGPPAVVTFEQEFDQIKVAIGYIIDMTVYFSIIPPATYLWDDGLHLDEVVVAPRTRIYFSAVGVPNKDLVRVKDAEGEFENNSGGEDYELYHAGSAGTVHLAINSVLLYNVCPPA
jgi:hypothetical protein